MDFLRPFRDSFELVAGKRFIRVGAAPSGQTGRRCDD
jgi:hypothetical protein